MPGRSMPRLTVCTGAKSLALKRPVNVSGHKEVRVAVKIGVKKKAGSPPDITKTR